MNSTYYTLLSLIANHFPSGAPRNVLVPRMVREGICSPTSASPLLVTARTAGHLVSKSRGHYALSDEGLHLLAQENRAILRIGTDTGCVGSLEPAQILSNQVYRLIMHTALFGDMYVDTKGLTSFTRQDICDDLVSTWKRLKPYIDVLIRFGWLRYNTSTKRYYATAPAETELTQDAFNQTLDTHGFELSDLVTSDDVRKQLIDDQAQRQSAMGGTSP